MRGCCSTLIFAKPEKKKKKQGCAVGKAKQTAGEVEEFWLYMISISVSILFPDVINTDPKCSGYKMAVKCLLALIQ